MYSFASQRGVLLGLAGLLLWGCAENDRAVAEPGHARDEKAANRLARETSPYLLAHAHNPVDWYPWGPEAFEKARADNKPIFLSVGYSSCYWCHVMERLVFENPEIAAAMNEHFVCVKVDREERPDVDDIYMTALQVYFQAIGSNQGGGWPLSLFLTPDGKPIAGGTYFPPKDDGGRMGFPTVMKTMATHWKENQKAVEANADLIAREVRRLMKPQLALQPVALDQKLVAAATEALLKSYDPKYGGLDFDPENPDDPKFPVPAKLALLQDEVQRNDNADAARALDHTLDQLAAGGIRDHLGGGFHRYSTDREWHVPHFEKMLYDQAQLAVLYVDAFQRTNRQPYRETAKDIFAFVLREMTDPRGGFYSALDAETDGVEGEYYVWSKAEIEKILGPEDAPVFMAVYGVDEPQVFEAGYVLHMSTPIEQAAESFDLAPSELKNRLAALRRKLLASRETRKPLLCDDKILTSWNGLMIGALAQAGKVLGREDYVRAAEKAALFVLSEMRDDEGRLQRSYRARQAKLNAYLDDYAFLVAGLLDLHEATGDEKWLNAAQHLTDDQIARFWDDAGHGFFFTSTDHEELLARTRTAYDAVLPSGNSVSVRNLVRLAELTGNDTYRDRARQTLEAFAPALEQSPRSCAVLALGLAEYLGTDDAGQANSEDESTDPLELAADADALESSERAAVLPADAGDAATPAAAVLQVSGEANPSEKGKKPQHVTAKAFLSVDRLPAGSSCEIVVILDILDDWHVNTNPAQPETLVPTQVSFKGKRGVELAKVFYPPGKKIIVQGLQEPQLIYEKQVAIRGILNVPARAAGGDEEMTISIRYQACNDDLCLPPKTITLNGKLPVAPPGERVKSINQNLFPPLKKSQE